MDDVVYAGVDTHAKTHALCVITRREEVVFEGRFSADETGYVELERALEGPERCACVAIEGCTGYGRGLADHLKAARPSAISLSPCWWVFPAASTLPSFWQGRCGCCFGATRW